MSEQRLRDELVAAFRNRALIYYHMYVELSAEVGEEKATDIMKRAIRGRGKAVGKAFSQYSPADLDGLREAFLGGIPDGGKLFDPTVERCDSEGLDICFKRCPLKEAWLEAGLDDEIVQKLCEIAAVVDNGTFEGAGFRFHADTWKPGGDGCCHLHIRPGN
jgi:hypothetical protein